MVAIGFATALGAGAVAFATILMVVSPAESEWQPRPSLAAASGVKTLPTDEVNTEPSSIGPAPTTGERATGEASAPARLASAEPANASSGVTVQRPTGAPAPIVSASAPEPNNQRWARSTAVNAPAQQPLAAKSAVDNEVGGETPAIGTTDEQRVAAIPLTALAGEPARPAEPSVEEDEQPAAEAEPSSQRQLRLSSSANLRARPANGARVLGTISGGTSVASFGCKGGWCEVSANGKRGFIASRFLGEKAKVRRASASPSKKRAARSPKRAPRRAAAPAAVAAPVTRTEKATLPGVFPADATTSSGDR